MTPLPITEWQAALAEMEAVLDGSASSLAQYEDRWKDDPPGPARPADQSEALLASLDGRLREWDARLTAAVELAAGVERDLTAVVTATGHWLAALGSWREVIERWERPAS